MNKRDVETLVKGLKKLKKEHEPNIGTRSTIIECVDFLLAALGVKI